MSLLPAGPIREIDLSPLHELCIGELLERAAANVLAREVMRCLCIDCIPNQIAVEAWHLYWAGARVNHDAGDEST